MYYNYFYLNPFKKGKFTYPYVPICFLYEPFYVGKGKGKRYLSHIKECKDRNNKSSKCFYIRYILNKMSEDEFKSYIIRIGFTNNEEMAYKRERIYINQIGLLKDNSGSLTNKKDKGKRLFNKKILKNLKKFRNSLDF